MTLPNTKAEWDAVITNAPDDTKTVNSILEKQLTHKAIVVSSGGFAAVREQFTKMRAQQHKQ